MNKFKDVSLIIVGVLFVLLIIEYQTLQTRYQNQEKKIFDELDYNQDGIVSKAELKFYLMRLQNSQKDKKIELHDIKKLIFTGALRGFFMGLILQDFEGGLTLAFIFGLLNPLISTTERIVF
jgi:hypothetical protein